MKSEIGKKIWGVTLATIPVIIGVAAGMVLYEQIKKWQAPKA